MIKPVLYTPDTWALWNPDDKRTISTGSKSTIDELLAWYGTNSPAWDNLLSTKIQRPEIMFVGQNPSKNNDKIIVGTNLSIQCFHTNSTLDRYLKNAIQEIPYFEGSYMTDVFSWAYEESDKKISLEEIEKRYPDEWIKIYKEAKSVFVEKINNGFGSLAIIALGNYAFSYIKEFLSITMDIYPRVKKFEVASLKNNLRIYRTDHPSPLNAKYRKLFIDQLKAIGNDLQTNGR